MKHLAAVALTTLGLDLGGLSLAPKSAAVPDNTAGSVCRDFQNGVSWSQEVMRVQQVAGVSMTQAEQIVINIENALCPGASESHGQQPPMAGFIDFGDGSWN